MALSNPDVFVSYRREDGAVLADAVASTLANQGYSVFFDKKTLRSGSNFPEEIRSAASSAKEFIAVVSPSYLGANNAGQVRIEDDSDWVRKELELVLARDGVNVFPIAIDCDFPSKECLPPSIAPLVDLNYRKYDPKFDTIEKLLEPIKLEFHPETIENALIGSVIKELQGVDPNDALRFNIACKSISKLVKTDSDCNALMRILADQNNVSRASFSNDYRFAAFYTLFSYYRRNHRALDLVSFVESYTTEFHQYYFFEYALTEYYTLKAKLSSSPESRNSFLLLAVNQAKNALIKLPDNAGIIHSYCLTVAEALEYKIELGKDIVETAVTLSSNLVESHSEYARYHSTHARLLAQIGRYEEALAHISQAEILEVPGHEDWVLRVAGYYKDEMAIRQMQHRQ